MPGFGLVVTSRECSQVRIWVLRGFSFVFLFNGFFIALHLDIVTYESAFFVGDVSSSVDEYPLVLWLAIIAAVAQATLIPKKTERLQGD